MITVQTLPWPSSAAAAASPKDAFQKTFASASRFSSATLREEPRTRLPALGLSGLLAASSLALWTKAAPLLARSLAVGRHSSALLLLSFSFLSHSSLISLRPPV